jgi:succinate-semialdehyde dehydrogenase/glutarate-semialdehyde dehydrogenase
MTYQSLNPYDGKLLRSFDDISDLQFEHKLAAAQVCFEIWRYTTFAYRA